MCLLFDTNFLIYVLNLNVAIRIYYFRIFSWLSSCPDGVYDPCGQTPRWGHRPSCSTHSLSYKPYSTTRNGWRWGVQVLPPRSHKLVVTTPVFKYMVWQRFNLSKFGSRNVYTFQVTEDGKWWGSRLLTQSNTGQMSGHLLASLRPIPQTGMFNYTKQNGKTEK